MIVNFIGQYGVGKTHLVKEFQKKHPEVFVFYEEPLNNPFVREVYALGSKQAFEMQLAFFTDSLEHFCNILERSDNVKILDRSLMETLIHYPRMLYTKEQITKNQLTILRNLFDDFVFPQLYHKNEILHVVCTAPPDIVFKRIYKRRREYEVEMNKEETRMQVELLHDIYEGAQLEYKLRLDSVLNLDVYNNSAGENVILLEKALNLNDNL